MCSLIVSQIEMFEVHRRIMYFTESTQQWERTENGGGLKFKILKPLSSAVLALSVLHWEVAIRICDKETTEGRKYGECRQHKTINLLRFIQSYELQDFVLNITSGNKIYFFYSSYISYRSIGIPLTCYRHAFDLFHLKYFEIAETRDAVDDAVRGDIKFSTTASSICRHYLTVCECSTASHIFWIKILKCNIVLARLLWFHFDKIFMGIACS